MKIHQTLTRPTAIVITAIMTATILAAQSGTAPAAFAEPGCGQGSWTAGTVDLCAGELVYRDYVYDDHGASLLVFPDDRMEGFYSGIRLPNDAYGDLTPAGLADLGTGLNGVRDNTADLIALRMHLEGASLHISAELNTMFTADDAFVVVGFDTDNDPGTNSSPTWPESIIASPFLIPGTQSLTNSGLDHFVTLKDGDPDTNLLETTVPIPAGTAWRLQAVVARTVEGTADPVAMNVAFRGLDERGNWWENAQAKALAANDITEFSATIDVADLAGGVTRLDEVIAGLVRQRVYVSDYPVGEGLRPGDGVLAKPYQALGTIDFLGKYQPYGLVIPDAPGPYGIQFVLHGLGENHSALLADPAGMQNPPPIAQKFGIPFNRIVIVALARGPGGFYVGPAERDFLDVLADVQARYPVDADKIFGGGMSMGGYGGLRMAVLHPDLFAATVTWVAFTGDAANGTPAVSNGLSSIGALGNAVDLLGNIRHVPLGALYSGQDELVHVNEALAVRDRLAELSLPSAHWLHHGGTHSTFPAIQDYGKESAWSDGRLRVQDPPRVTYRTDERFYDPDLDLFPDGAYWVDRIVPAGAGYADVDAITFGCGLGDAVTELSTGTGTDPVPWDAQYIEVVGETSRPAENRIELYLANVESVAVDVGGRTAPVGGREACLSSDPLAYHVETDVPVRIAFSDGRSLDLDAGVWDGVLGNVLTNQGEVAPVSSAPDPLPTTGGGLVPGAVALMAAGLAARRRRARRGPA